MSARCAQCEEHAKLHRGNVLGVGAANDPCAQCEAHARMHSDDCFSVLLIVTVAVVAAAYRVRGWVR